MRRRACVGQLGELGGHDRACYSAFIGGGQVQTPHQFVQWLSQVLQSHTETQTSRPAALLRELEDDTLEIVGFRQ